MLNNIFRVSSEINSLGDQKLMSREHKKEKFLKMVHGTRNKEVYQEVRIRLRGHDPSLQEMNSILEQAQASFDEKHTGLISSTVGRFNSQLHF